MNNGYPSYQDAIAYLNDRGIEEVTEWNEAFITEFCQLLYALTNFADWAGALGVYCPSSATFNVRGGNYLFAGTVKTYTPGDAVDPTDNDTTYIWLKTDNTIDSAVDGTGWPTTEHVKLAEIDVDADGIITAIRDLRGKTFLNYIGNYLNSGGSSVQALPVHWDSPSPAAGDELQIPVSGENDASEKTEYARLTVKLTRVADGAEAADVLISRMIGGALTSLGRLMGVSDFICWENNVVCYGNEPITI